MTKRLLSKGIRHPRKIALFLGQKTKRALRRQSYEGAGARVRFKHEGVVSDWGIDSAGLPHFSARLYKEVRLLNAAIGTFHAERSLEIGCGYGRLTPWIAEHSNQHFAVEPETRLLEDARQLYPDVRFFQTTVQELPFQDGYFDLSVSWTVLGHIPPKEIGRAIAELQRVCSRHAVIILAEGVGKTKNPSDGYWEYAVEEWQDFLSPWRIVYTAERRIEETHSGAAGLIMRFER